MKPDITDYRLDRLREDLDIARDLLARLSAQVAEHDAALVRVCHGRPTELPEEAIFEICIHGKGWSIQEIGDPPYAAKASYWWVAYSESLHGGSRQGQAISIPDAMDKIRKAHAELGVTP